MGPSPPPSPTPGSAARAGRGRAGMRRGARAARAAPPWPRAPGGRPRRTTPPRAPDAAAQSARIGVWGVALLFRGRRGSGKSDCVLVGVGGGPRVVGDDVAHVTRRGNDVLRGGGQEISRHYMEIRGVGLIDINALFGIRSVRQQKRIEVVVQLEDWDNTREYDRTGLDQQRTDLLDVQLPLVTVPLNPGKNRTGICQVVAMNHLLRYSGVDSANAFNERLIRRMREKGGVQSYLEEDYE